MMKKLTYLFSISILLFWACTSAEVDHIAEDLVVDENGWTVPSADIRGGGETFGLMNTPSFKSVSETTSLKDTSKVAMVSFKNEVRVYPYHYTNFYEIVNDVFDGKKIAVSFCPITNSAICFDRTMNGETYDFVASGYLYKFNMVPSDKALKFFYSQMLMTRIKGQQAEQVLDQFNLIETQWKTVKTYFPEAQVFYHQNEAEPTVGSTKSEPIKPVEDGNYFYGILNQLKGEEVVDLFEYEAFSEPVVGLTTVINDRNAIVIGSEAKRIFATYYVPKDGSLQLLDEAQFPNVLTDQRGNIYSIFGYAVSGPDQGHQLESPRSLVAQYWAWKDFYPNLSYQ